MKIAVSIALGLLALVATTPAGAMKPVKPDCAAALASVQVNVAAMCDCASAETHGKYVKCAGKVVKAMATDGSLGKSCKGSMVRVFAKSSCGKADAVTCCVATACGVKKSAACANHGGVPGATPFCADACAASPSGAFVN